MSKGHQLTINVTHLTKKEKNKKKQKKKRKKKKKKKCYTQGAGAYL